MLRSLLAAVLTACALSGQAQSIERAVPTTRADTVFSYAPIVRRAAPAVVNVYAEHVEPTRGNPLLDDPLFRQFFGGNAQPSERVQRSLGSGVIVRPDGLIVTNYHVIAKATQVRVALSDRREFQADIVLKDERADLAVLRIKDAGVSLPALPIADADTLEVGDLVLAIGDPFGVGQTVTQGIVSALARSQAGLGDFQSFIQTDAAINPGNSGGALVDMQGRLAGINTAIVSGSGGNIGIGFAIPAAMVRVVVSSAQAGARQVQRPWIGARLQSVTPALAESIGLAAPSGALVASVRPKGPMQEAGIEAGDVITAIDGATIADITDFGYRLATKPIGATTRLKVLHAGASREVEVALVKAPGSSDDATPLTEPSPLQGATVATLSPALAESLALDDDTAGVVLVKVPQGSTADQLGFLPKDIVVALDGQRISDVRGLERALVRSQQFWRVTLSRDGRQITQLFGG